MWAAVPAVDAAEIWDFDDGVLTFVKEPFADWQDPANQDRITDNVWLTRGDLFPLLNAKTQTPQFDQDPADTEWAFSLQNGNPFFVVGGGAEQYQNLNFSGFIEANRFQIGNVVEYFPAVLHLITDDIYIDVRFHMLAWSLGSNGGGAFAYDRAINPNPVPAPVAAGIALPAIAIGAMRRPRRRA
ncbi:MAG: hypothetical protein CMJ49_02325 [Planctomycetaceae bacterium]|nr:hypothetical protein [Planctomycetaceae bacterium]